MKALIRQGSSETSEGFTRDDIYKMIKATIDDSKDEVPFMIKLPKLRGDSEQDWNAVASELR